MTPKPITPLQSTLKRIIHKLGPIPTIMLIPMRIQAYFHFFRRFMGRFSHHSSGRFFHLFLDRIADRSSDLEDLIDRADSNETMSTRHVKVLIVSFPACQNAVNFFETAQAPRSTFSSVRTRTGRGERVVDNGRRFLVAV